MTVQRKKPSARRRARECATQALYAWAVSQNAPEAIELAFMTDQEEELKGTDKPYFSKVFRQTVNNVDQIDATLAPFLDRDLTELDPIERAILRLAAYELLFEMDVPYKVVINEAIEVAKAFGAEESHKYINGVLDKLAPTCRR